MVDLLPHVADVLSTTGAQIELSYNDISATIPLIVLSEIDNRSAIVSDSSEVYSGVTVQVDIYHYDEQRARELAIKAAELMTAAGFRRSYSSPIHEDNLFRYTMRFGATVYEAKALLFGSEK